MTSEKKFIEEAVVKLNISTFMEKSLSKAGFARVEIQRTPVLTRITAYVLKPGRVIGRSGKTINELTETISKTFAIKNPQINVVEIEDPMLEPMIVAKDIAYKIEKSINARKILQRTLKDILSRGALGAEIVISGKVAAKSARKKKIRKSIGYIPKVGDVIKFVRVGHATAYPKHGAIGIKVRIVPPGTKFPDREIKKIEIPREISNA
jgi:small subunit ribosomal protein S3